MWNITSSIDWCEDNFVYISYIAELYNALSSFSMVIAGLLLMDHSVNIFYIMYVLLIIVGIGSVLFHSMLTNFTQALDEVPMIWTAISMIYFALRELKSNNVAMTSLLIKYGIGSSYFIIVNEGNTQFKCFHILNTIVTMSVVLLYYKLAKKNGKMSLYIKSALYFGAGIVCWCIDLWYCEYVKDLKLHALWHIFSSLGCYNVIKILKIEKNEKKIINYR